MKCPKCGQDERHCVISHSCQHAMMYCPICYEVYTDWQIAEISALKQENERLDHLHKLDHSLADQRQLKIDRLTSALREIAEHETLNGPKHTTAYFDGIIEGHKRCAAIARKGLEGK